MLLVWASSGLAQTAGETEVRAALESAATSLLVGKDHEALAALATVEQAEPDNPWMLFYKGVAHLHLGNAYESLTHLDRAQEVLLEMGDPDPELMDKIRMQRVKARRQVFGLSYQAGWAYDSNVAYLGSGVTGVDLITGVADWKFGTNFNIHYSPVATEEEALTASVRIGSSWYTSVEQFNDQDYGLSLRYARKLNDHFDASIQYDYDFTLLGNESFVSDHGLTSSLSYNWDRSVAAFQPRRTTLYHRIDALDFLFETTRDFDRDGFANAFGIDQTFQWRPIRDVDWTWDLSGGYRLEFVPTEGSEFDRIVNNWFFGVAMPLPSLIPDQELIFRFNLHWILAKYQEPSQIDREGDNRDDVLRILSWSLSQRIFDDPQIGQLTVHAIINWTDTKSNVTASDGSHPFTYDKTLYGLQLEWAW